MYSTITAGEDIKKKKMSELKTYHGNLGPETHDVPPGVAEDVRQVEDKVDEATARGC